MAICVDEVRAMNLKPDIFLHSEQHPDFSCAMCSLQGERWQQFLDSVVFSHGRVDRGPSLSAGGRLGQSLIHENGLPDVSRCGIFCVRCMRDISMKI